ncbi:MAG: YegP family protein [Ruminococcus sp.]|nr:YegP family protein [Ruminococcus sp.]
MGKFVIKETKTGHTFSLKAGNGEIIAIGGEVYNSLASCKNGCESVKKNAPAANLEDQTVEGFAAEKCPKFEMYADKKGEFRFRLKATNGQVICASEGYTSKASCKNGIESVRKNAADADIVLPEADK